MANHFICKCCGEEYTSRKKISTYCSRECRRADKNVKLSCDYCGKEYYKGKSTIKEGQINFYCSKECFDKAQDKKITKRCLNCGKEYKIGRCFGDIQKFCSRNCYYDYRDNHKRYEVRICPICENEFYPHQDSTIFCSNECKFIHSRKRIAFECENCGKLVENRIESEYLKNKHHFCSQECIRIYYNWSGITDLATYIRQRLSSWRNNVVESNNHRCCLTGETENLVVHHCRGFNVILNEVINQLDLDSGRNFSDYTIPELDKIYDAFLNIQERDKQYVCITSDIHKKFHSEYGYGNNTNEQWIEFVSKYYS